MADTEWIDTPGHRGSPRRNGAGGDPSSPARQPSSRGGSLSQPHAQSSQTAESSTSPSSTPMRQLEFNQAMNDFHHMFPSMDRDVIEAVLRANNGIVDATIDQLLTMSIDNNDEDDLPDHILMSVQRDVALESLNENTHNLSLNHKSSSPRLSKQDDPSMEESPPSYTEAIKSPQVLAAYHRHHSHRHHRRLSPPESQRRGSPRHHAHHHLSPPVSRATLLDLATDDIVVQSTDTKQPLSSWESATMGLPRHSSNLSESPSRRIGWNDVNTFQSKRSALKTSTSVRHHSANCRHEHEDISAPRRSPHHHSSRKVSWDTAPLPMRSKSFGGADSKRNLSSSSPHRQSLVKGNSGKLPPYRNWNPPLLGTLPDDFLRLKPKVPERIPLMTQKSDPGAPRSHTGTSFHRSLSGREELVETSPSHWRSQAHHIPFRSMSFAGSSSSRSGMPQRLITQDISTDFIQRRMRENERRRRQASVDLDPELSQYLEDERLALILQNSEFLQELRDDETFMKTLERDRQTAADEYASAQELKQQSLVAAAAMQAAEAVISLPLSIEPEDQEGYGDDRQDTLEAFPFSQQLPKASEEDAEFLQKLRHMGKASKKQFAALARRFFSRKRKKSPRHLLRESLAPSMTNLLDEEEGEEEDENEVLGTSPAASTQTYSSGRSGFRVDGLPPNNSTTDFV